MTTPPAPPAKVPADFEQAKVERESAQLTPEEVAEFRALRAAQKDRDAAAAKEAAEAAARLQPLTHHVHLADGSRVDGSTIETHYATEHGQMLPVAGAWLKPEFANLG
jgi:hypothetical protein